MGKRSARAKNKRKWLKKAVAPTLKNYLQIIPREDFLRMIKEKGEKAMGYKVTHLTLENSNVIVPILINEEPETQ